MGVSFIDFSFICTYVQPMILAKQIISPIVDTYSYSGKNFSFLRSLNELATAGTKRTQAQNDLQNIYLVKYY